MPQRGREDHEEEADGEDLCGGEGGKGVSEGNTGGEGGGDGEKGRGRFEGRRREEGPTKERAMIVLRPAAMVGREGGVLVVGRVVSWLVVSCAGQLGCWGGRAREVGASGGSDGLERDVATRREFLSAVLETKRRVHWRRER